MSILGIQKDHNTKDKGCCDAELTDVDRCSKLYRTLAVEKFRDTSKYIKEFNKNNQTDTQKTSANNSPSGFGFFNFPDLMSK